MRPTTEPSPSRRRRLLAAALDAAALLALFGGALLLALAWLLARTEAGRFDVGDGDAVVAAALLAASVPAWLTWLATGLLEGATPGERRAGLAVVTRPDATSRRARTSRLLRLALHPLAVPAWLWLALLLLVLGLTPLTLALLAVAGLVALGALASTVLWAARPAAPALHDRLARTRLVAS